MALNKVATLVHIFNSDIDETATASSIEFCIIWGDIYDNNGVPPFYGVNIQH